MDFRTQFSQWLVQHYYLVGIAIIIALILFIMGLIDLGDEQSEPVSPFQAMSIAFYFLMLVGLGVFNPSNATLLKLLISWVVIGNIYALWSWIRYCRKVVQTVQIEVKSNDHWPKDLLLNSTWTTRVTSVEEAFRLARPKIEQNWSKIRGWIVFWPISLLQFGLRDALMFIPRTFKKFYQFLGDRSYHNAVASLDKE